MRIAIQGVAGSYHHIAAMNYFGENVQLLCCKTFPEVFEALSSKHADIAVVAAENSTAGSVHPVYDLLLQYQFAITGEVYESIHHCLIGQPNTELKQVTKVYSHSMALPQCTDFLDKQLPHAERIEYSDTAASVALIKQMNDPHAAAIASSLAAEIHGLPVLQANIENHQNNATRFLVLDINPAANTKANKSSLVLETPHQPGALWHALGVFASADANLAKLESRPIPHEPWHYQFLLDVELAGESLNDILQKLKSMGCSVRMLGSYTSNNEVTK
jgi:prephenate dehydratase